MRRAGRRSYANGRRPLVSPQRTDWGWPYGLRLKPQPVARQPHARFRLYSAVSAGTTGDERDPLHSIRLLNGSPPGRMSSGATAMHDDGVNRRRLLRGAAALAALAVAPGPKAGVHTRLRRAGRQRARYLLAARGVHRPARDRWGGGRNQVAADVIRDESGHRIRGAAGRPPRPGRTAPSGRRSHGPDSGISSSMVSGTRARSSRIPGTEASRSPAAAIRGTWPAASSS